MDLPIPEYSIVRKFLTFRLFLDLQVVITTPIYLRVSSVSPCMYDAPLYRFTDSILLGTFLILFFWHRCDINIDTLIPYL